MNNASEIKFVALLAKALPQEAIIEMIQKSITKYNEAKMLNKSKEELKECTDSLAGFCMLFLNKVADIDPNVIGQEVEDIERIQKMLKPDQQ